MLLGSIPELRIRWRDRSSSGLGFCETEDMWHSNACFLIENNVFHCKTFRCEIMDLNAVLGWCNAQQNETLDISVQSKKREQKIITEWSGNKIPSSVGCTI